MKVAALYDIHGNYPALEAVLTELTYVKPDIIVIGGDIVSGPMSAQTLDRLLALQKTANVIFIRGNGDRKVVAASKSSKRIPLTNLVKPGKAKQYWVAQQLTKRQLAFLENLKPTASIPLKSIGDTLFCHATPYSDSDVFTPKSDARTVAKLFSQVPESIIVCGHTHLQFKLKIGQKTIYNAGSVGMPFAEQPGAYWLLLDSNQHKIQFRRTAYDLDRAAEILRTSGDPQIEFFIERKLRHVPTPQVAMRMLHKMVLK
ncbi:MAG: metallophosphatase family protein [Lactobacillus sp.]|jgi:predicted phosphodiesterase|nr:metallophosphatase family protein [Lactobacillus sp.]